MQGDNSVSREASTMESLKSTLKGALEAELARIPQPFRHGPVIHQTIKCFLYGMVKEADLSGLLGCETAVS